MERRHSVNPTARRWTRRPSRPSSRSARDGVKGNPAAAVQTGAPAAAIVLAAVTLAGWLVAGLLEVLR